MLLLHLFRILVTSVAWPHFVATLVIGSLSYLLLRRRSSQAVEAATGMSGASKQCAAQTEGAAEAEDDDVLPALPDDLEHVPFKYTRYSEEEMHRRARHFYELMNGRRSIRFFSSEPVPKQVLNYIVLTAGTSPSGAHTEPWTYVAVSSPELKESVREIVEMEERINYESRMGSKWTTDLRPLRTDWEKPYLTEAPVLLLVFKQTYGMLPGGDRKVHYYNEISCCLSVGLLLAAVQNAGLVTLTSTPLNCGPALRGLLNRPVNEKLLLLLPLGYPSATATVPKLHRKPLEQLLISM